MSIFFFIHKKIQKPGKPLLICPGQMVQQTVAGIFEQVEHQFETVGPAVIGIGHMVVGIAAGIVGHAVNLRPGISIGRQAAQILDVHVVHTDDKVETVEIVGRYGTRAMFETIAPAGGMSPHTGVGQIACVTAISTGRVDVKSRRQTALLHLLLHDALSSRRTADVAEADKQYATGTGGSRCGHIGM